MSNAISSFQANLMVGTPGSGSSITWSRLVEIKDFPDLSSAPEALEKTTTADPPRTFIEGITGNDQKTFSCNYNATDYATLTALKGVEKDVAIWFGASETNGVYTPDGHLGKFKGKGLISVFVNGAGINEVVNMTVSLTMTQGFVKEAS